MLPRQEIYEFLIISFSVSAILSLLFFLWYNRVNNQNIGHLFKLRLLSIIIGAGVSTAFGNQLILLLAGRTPDVVLFPLVNGGIVTASTVVSVIIFKEHLSLKGIIGLVMGLIALVLLSIK